MAFMTQSWLLDILVVLFSTLFLLYVYLRNIFSYFKSKGIPCLSLKQTRELPRCQALQSRYLYNCFPEEKFFGYFLLKDAFLLVKDPDLVQRILVKDFTHFQDRGFLNVESDYLNAKNLFHMKGQAWRAFRNKLTPTFTSGKLKLMFDQFTKSGDNLLKHIENDLGKPFDAKQLSVDFATEVIASTAFGLDFSKENPQSVEFINKITNAFTTNFRQIVIFYVNSLFPKIANWLRLSFAAPGTEKYFRDLVKATKHYREINNIQRNDYFGLLLELQKSEENETHYISPSDAVAEEDSYLSNGMGAPEMNANLRTYSKLLTDEVITAQAFGFLLGGSDSVSGTLSFALFHIAKDPVVQRKVTEELNTVFAKHGGCTYQAVKEMKYLDTVLQETLRMYPVISLTMRECVVPYSIPDTDIILEKGTKVNIPVTGLHMDPMYYPEPDIFNPERFADNNHKPNPKYLPFGDGPRICIALRFAVVEMKVCLAKILSQYSLEVNCQTKEPFDLDEKAFSPKPLGGIWVDLKKRTES